MKSGRIIMGVDLTGNVTYDAYYICNKGERRNKNYI